MTKYYINIDIVNVLKPKQLKVLLSIVNLLKFKKSIKISVDNLLANLGLDYVYEDSEKQYVIDLICDLSDYGLINLLEKTQEHPDFFTISLSEDVMYVEKKIKTGDAKCFKKAITNICVWILKYIDANVILIVDIGTKK